MYWLDTLLISLIALGGLLGLWSGFVLQVARLLSMSLALSAAVFLNDPATQFLQEQVVVGAEPRVAQVAAYVTVFLLTYLILIYLARQLRKTVRTSELAWLDRVLGCLLSAGKVTAFLSALCLLAVHYPHPTTQEWAQNSTLVPVFAQGVDTTLSWLPEKYRPELGNGIPGLNPVLGGKEEKKSGKERAGDGKDRIRLELPGGGLGLGIQGLLPPGEEGLPDLNLRHLLMETELFDEKPAGAAEKK